MLPILVGACLTVLLGVALHDVAFRTIPNWMPATLLLLGGGVRALEGGMARGLLACALTLLGAGLCWRRGWLGGGDAKLLAACALLVPPGLVLPMLLDTALAGGALALLYLSLGRVLTPPRAGRPSSGRPAGLLRRVARAERHRICRRAALPYGSAIAAGAVLTLLKG